MKNLPQNILTMLQHMGIEKLNDMQQRAIEAARTSDNVVLLSPTGSGKTLAFLLPMILALKPHNGMVQTVILAPSRELALQIDEVFKRLRTGFKVSCCYGGHEFKTEVNNLLEPPAVLVGTPGRILDHIKRGNLNLKQAHSLVLDEFDKCLDMGFADEMSEILSFLPGVRKRMLTSATSLSWIPDFTGIRQAATLNFLTEGESASKLIVRRVNAYQADKLSTLLLLIGKLGEQSMLVFLNHREAVERVSAYLDEQGVVHDIFHGGLEQKERERTFVRFRNGSCRIMVTTDLAARGLDIPAIDAVIHYHLPVNEEAYIHRNGRTARMNAQGAAYVIFGPDEPIPEFIPDNLHFESLPADFKLPPQPQWATLYIGRGKKDKVNKVDIVGFLCQKGDLAKEEIGLIDVKDNFAYVAVNRAKSDKLVYKLRNEKLKNRSIKIEVAY